MTSEKRTGWFAQIAAAIGVLVWIGATMHFELYPITILIAVFAIPATISNIANEARSTEPVCR